MAGGGVLPCLTLEALPKTRPKKAGGWQRRHGTGPDKQDTLLTKLNGRLQVTEVGDGLIIVLDNPLLILRSTWFGYFSFTLRYLYLDLTN